MTAEVVVGGGGLWYILKQFDGVIDIWVFPICFYCLGGEL